MQTDHKRCARSNAVRIETRRVRQLFSFLTSQRLLGLGFFSGSESDHKIYKYISSYLIVLPNIPPTTLLVHLRPGRNTVHGHKKQFLRFDRPEQRVDVVENVHENLLFGDAKLNVRVVRMGAIVNDSVHVQVKVVELGNLHSKEIF